MILNRSCIIIVPFVIIYFVSTPAAAIIADRLTFESNIEKTDTPRRRDHYREMKLRLRTNHAPIYALFSVSSSPPKKSHAFESDKIYRSDVWLKSFSFSHPRVLSSPFVFDLLLSSEIPRFFAPLDRSNLSPLCEHG